MTCQVPSVAYEGNISIHSQREFVITTRTHHNKHDDDALSFYVKDPQKLSRSYYYT